MGISSNMLIIIGTEAAKKIACELTTLTMNA